MKQPRTPLLVTGVGTLVLAMAACGGRSVESTAGATIGFSSPVMAQTGQAAIADGLSAAGEAYGWDIQVYDANLSADTQVSNIQTMVDRGDDAIAAWALDDGAIAGAYAQAQSSDIPVVGLNSDGPAGSVWWEQQTCDSDGIIEQLAGLFADAKPGGSIAVLSGPEAPSIIALTACFSDAAKAHGLDVITEQKNTSDDAAGANALAQDILSKYPDLDGIWAYNDNTAQGASAAILAAGKTIYTDAEPDGIVVTGANGDEAAIEAIKSGTMTATVDPDPTCTGYAMAVALKDAMDDGRLSRDYVVKGTIVTGENVDSYVPPAQMTCSLDNLPLVG